MTKAKQNPKHPKYAGRKKIVLDYAKAENLAARGMTMEQIAACCGFSDQTLYTKMKEDPKFKEAIEKGKAAGIAAVTASLLKNISLGRETSIIFFLKCRAGWKETTVVENRDLPPVPDDACSPDEAERIYMESMAPGSSKKT